MEKTNRKRFEHGIFDFEDFTPLKAQRIKFQLVILLFLLDSLIFIY